MGFKETPILTYGMTGCRSGWKAQTGSSFVVEKAPQL